MRQQWKTDEIAQLAHWVRVHGAAWSFIANKMPGRTPEQCRQRWVTNAETKRASFSLADDLAILKRVAAPMSSWAAIAKDFDGTSGTHIRNRWLLLMRRSTAPDGSSWSTLEAAAREEVLSEDRKKASVRRVKRALDQTEATPSAEDLHDLPAVTAAAAAAEDEPSAGDLHDPPAVTAAAAAAEDEPSAEDEPKPTAKRARTGENRWRLWGSETQAAQAALALVDKARKEEEALRRTTRPSARSMEARRAGASKAYLIAMGAVPPSISELPGVTVAAGEAAQIEYEQMSGDMDAALRVGAAAAEVAAAEAVAEAEVRAAAHQDLVGQLKDAATRGEVGRERAVVERKAAADAAASAAAADLVRLVHEGNFAKLQLLLEAERQSCGSCRRSYCDMALAMATELFAHVKRHPEAEAHKEYLQSLLAASAEVPMEVRARRVTTRLEFVPEIYLTKSCGQDDWLLRGALRLEVLKFLKERAAREEAELEASQPKAACGELVDAYNAANEGNPWSRDCAYLQFGVSDDASYFDEQRPGWPEAIRLLVAALLPLLAARVPGLLNGLDQNLIEQVRAFAAKAVPKHVASLPGFQQHALAAAVKARAGEGTANFPEGMSAAARGLHAICRCIRQYEFVMGKLMRIHSVHQPSMAVIIDTKAEADFYLQRTEADGSSTGSEHVTDATHAWMPRRAGMCHKAAFGYHGPCVLLQPQMFHQSVCLLHAGSEHCAKTVLNAPGSDFPLLLMAAAGRKLRHALEAVGYEQGWASLTHESSPFRWESLDLRSATLVALQHAMRAPLFLSYRISTIGSRSCSIETIEADQRCRPEAREDASAADAHERELR